MRLWPTSLASHYLGLCSSALVLIFTVVNTLEKMASWQEELKNALNTAKDARLAQVEKRYPTFIPPEYLAHINTSEILKKQFLPSIEEISQEGSIDPIGDHNFQVTGNLIHRYPNRVLFLPTAKCPINCRYCFRKNELNDGLIKYDFNDSFTYLNSHQEVEEVIFSGGDPLVLSNNKIYEILNRLSTMDHLKYIRFHTRFPVILPSRLDDELKKVLSAFAQRFKIHIVLHTNHLDEFSVKANLAISQFQFSGLKWLSQSVLLKGVNDNAFALKSLYHHLIELDITPYYLHHPDYVRGGEHFYLPLEAGREIYHQLKNLLPGWALPRYIIDIPEGHGKTFAYNGETLRFSGQLLARSGEIITFKDKESKEYFDK